MLIAPLLAASVYFGIGAESRRRQAQQSQGTLTDREVVSLLHVVDGDSVMVRNRSGQRVSIRLIGVKALAASAERGRGASFGAAAAAELKHRLTDVPIEVRLNDPPLDRHRRILAKLFLGENDVALNLVARGLLIAYPVHPFEGRPAYLAAQASARAERLGLWRDEEVSKIAGLRFERWEQDAK